MGFCPLRPFVSSKQIWRVGAEVTNRPGYDMQAHKPLEKVLILKLYHAPLQQTSVTGCGYQWKIWISARYNMNDYNFIWIPLGAHCYTWRPCCAFIVSPFSYVFFYYYSSVVRNTKNPIYDEDFTFYGLSLDELGSMSLHFVVLSFDRYSRDDVIGEVVCPLSSIDLQQIENQQVALSREIQARSLKVLYILLLFFVFLLKFSLRVITTHRLRYTKSPLHTSAILFTLVMMWTRAAIRFYALMTPNLYLHIRHLIFIFIMPHCLSSLYSSSCHVDKSTGTWRAFNQLVLAASSRPSDGCSVEGAESTPDGYYK